jgi:hypothetical protein
MERNVDNERDKLRDDVRDALIAAIPGAEKGGWAGAIKAPKYSFEVCYSGPSWARNPHLRITGSYRSYGRKPFYLAKTVDEALAKLPDLLAKLDAAVIDKRIQDERSARAQNKRDDDFNRMACVLIEGNFPAEKLYSGTLSIKTLSGEVQVGNSEGFWRAKLDLTNPTEQQMLTLLKRLNSEVAND